MTLNVPTVIDDDLIMFFGSCDGTNGLALPTGFTQIFDVATGGSHVNIMGYRKASSEPASYTVSTKSGTERAWACFATYRGVDIDAGPDVSSSAIGGSNATGVITSITPSAANSLVNTFVGIESGNNGASIAPTWPSSLIVRNDNVNGPTGSGNGSSSGAFADVIQTTASAVSGNVSLSGGNTFWGMMAVAWAEAGGVPPGTIALTGTVTASIQESAIVAGGKTIILTLTGDTFVSGAAFDNARQAIIDGITAA